MPNLIIDGYNLIRNAQKIFPHAPLNLEQERKLLINALAQYKKIKGHPILVVFDAAKALNPSLRKESIHGIYILYTEMGQIADEVIMRLARVQKERAIIISSDREIQRAAQRAGCGVLDCLIFENKLLSTIKSLKDFEEEEDNNSPPHKGWGTQKKGPARRLPKAQRRALRKIEGF